MATIPVGTRIVAEGPFGVFTEASRRREKVLLIAGGIGITPIRALLQQMRGDVVVLYRVVTDEEILFRQRARRARGRDAAPSCTTSSATTRPKRGART